MSLGLVNSFIKRLVRKGYEKVNTIPRNRARYILTQKKKIKRYSLGKQWQKAQEMIEE